MLAAIGLEALGLGAIQTQTLGVTIYWSQEYTAVLRGFWWWWGPPIAMIAFIFLALFVTSAGHGPLREPATPARLMATDIARRPPRLPAPRRAPRRGAGRPPRSRTSRSSTGRTPATCRPSTTSRSRCMPGQRLGLIGESGSGKTTMATALMRMTRPPGRIVGGRVFLGDGTCMTLDDNALRKIRLRDIAFVPQGAMNSLNPVMRIEDQMIDAIVAHESRAARRRRSMPGSRRSWPRSGCRRRSRGAIRTSCRAG